MTRDPRPHASVPIVNEVLTGFLGHGALDRTPGRFLPEELDRVTDPILVADNDRKYVDLNRAAVKALGRPKEAIVGRSIDDFFLEVDQQPIANAWQKFIGAGDQYGTCRLRGADGTIFVYRARANVMPGLHVCVLRRIK